jgi:hypothetical protein
MRVLLNLDKSLIALWMLAAAWSSPVLAQANDCQELPSPATTESAAAPGRQFLGQGIALFDAKNFKQAERALQSALFASLPDRQERASAHKYLAFVSCSNSEWLRCESEFDSAFSARPSFVLEAYELHNTPWRDAYLRAQTRWAQRCGGVPLTASAALLAKGASAATSALALNSLTTVGISPLPLPATDISQGFTPVLLESELSSGSNVRLRVSPWAAVQVDGKRLGVTPPLSRLNLAPGLRTIELSNPGFEPVRRVIRVVNGKTVTITHDFDSR